MCGQEAEKGSVEPHSHLHSPVPIPSVGNCGVSWRFPNLLGAESKVGVETRHLP